MASSSPAFLKAIVFAFCAILSVLTESVFAKHSGITRHYKFDVSTINKPETWVLFLFVPMLNSLFFFGYCCVDQVTKCDKVVSNKEHCDCEWKVSRATDHSKRR